MKLLLILIINFIILAFISCKSTDMQMKEVVEYHNKKTVEVEKPKVTTLKDRAGYYKSKSPYFTFDADLKENGYAYVVLKGWMVYRGYVKVGDPSSEATKFRLDIDNVTYVLLEFKDLNNAKASIVLENVVQQVLPMTKIQQ
ncbi:hypothetical protein JQ824_09200 [Brachyspira hyodysenteriae]|uniref:Lipoprotein n=1 Tax=Brachyspira hyodysenteriae ATCC 27164 TaxID=1266923 RepID=A0A3B6VP14_BRAHO|nr:hypothetical protein [Brachyspira hyodysenteriae]ANN62415.1 hypothetical protein BHYOB78_00660 [Brachyspira hyodysenteriae ATCC 27164]KLI16997.1 hypothetical protein SU44_04685 [Brachyspira hyodysenteriae]KLI24225.1 hypothetical protein SU43_05065 [Brachyspira hyodysenteriae]KLI25117.1 hypothetical protein SR30_07915 [Brachyspira hyodysenteriae]KLI28038.1 hypothetical protein SZ47_03165 [Brachyspira hyodysenteriae]